MRAPGAFFAAALLVFSAPAQAGPVLGRILSGAGSTPVVPVVYAPPSHAALPSAPVLGTVSPTLTLPAPVLPSVSASAGVGARASAAGAAATAASAASPTQALPAETVVPTAEGAAALDAPHAAPSARAASAPAAAREAAVPAAKLVRRLPPLAGAPSRWSAVFDGSTARREDSEPVSSESAPTRRPLLLRAAPALFALPAGLEFFTPAVPYAAGAAVLGGTWLSIRALDRLIGAVGRWRNWDPASLVVARLAGEVSLWAAGGSLALRAVGLDWSTVFTSLGIGGLAVTLATKEFLGNFIRGLVMMVDSPVRIGDLIKLEDKVLRVVDMSFRYMVFQEKDGEFLLVTYSSLAAQAFTLLERAVLGKADPAAPGLADALKKSASHGFWFWAGAAALSAGAVWLGFSVPAALPYVLAAGLLAGTALLERLANRLLDGAARRRGWSLTGAAVGRFGTTLGFYAAGLLAALSTAGVPWSVLLGGATVFGVAVSVAASDILSNLIQAVWLLLARPFMVGDKVMIGKAEGTVSDMTLRYVVLDSVVDGKPASVYVPYSAVAAGPLRIHKAYKADRRR
ncbi:MAG: mechanosensitive ion channel [Elusimicrobia bacterium]|nr:mechanosensitive ion channel [Elusimicrobiota bacterium]